MTDSDNLSLSDVMNVILSIQGGEKGYNMFNLYNPVDSTRKAEIDIKEIKKTLLTPSKISYLVSYEGKDIFPQNKGKVFFNSEDKVYEKKAGTKFPKFDFSSFPKLQKLTEGVFCGEDEDQLVIVRFLDNTIDELKEESKKYVVDETGFEHSEYFVIALVQNDSYFLLSDVDDHIHAETNFFSFFDTSESNKYSLIIQDVEGEFTPEKLFEKVMVPTVINSIFHSNY